MKNALRILAVGILFAATTFASAEAQNGKCNQLGSGSKGKGAHFVDANNDGICDNKTSSQCGLGKGKGAKFVDANNDGVCDNKGTKAAGGKRMNKNSGSKVGKNFIDADGDGVCDNKAAKTTVAPAAKK